MKNFKTSPISSILGLIVLIFAGVLLFVPTLYAIPLWSIGLIAVCGFLWCRAEDKLISVLTLGLSSFFQSPVSKASTSKKVGGEIPKDDDEV